MVPTQYVCWRYFTFAGVILKIVAVGGLLDLAIRNKHTRICWAGAEIVAYDKVLSENGKFRILAKNTGEKWPEAIQIGGGVKGFALLNNVPLFYELWRTVNGFPPDFYKTTDVSKKKNNKK